MIQYVDGSRFEGGIDAEERRHGTGVYVLKSGHTSEGGWVHGDFEGYVSGGYLLDLVMRKSEY